MEQAERLDWKTATTLFQIDVQTDATTPFPIVTPISLDEVLSHSFNESAVERAGYTAITVLLCALWLIGSAANGIVAAALMRSQLVRQDTFYALMLNLAVGDFFIAFLGSPAMIVAAWYRQWIWGQFWCSAYAFAMNCVGMMNICSLAVVAAVRRRVLASVKKSSSMSSKAAGSVGKGSGSAAKTSMTTTFLTIAGVWTYGLAITLPALLGWSEYVEEGVGVSCSLRWYADDPSQHIAIVSFALFELVIGFCVPCAVIGVCYFQVWQIVRQQANLVSGQVARVKMRVLVTVLAMTIAFLIAWLPYATVAVFAMVGYKLSDWTMTAPAMLAKTSTIMNPMIYFLTNASIRHECLDLLRAFARVLKPSQFHTTANVTTGSASTRNNAETVRATITQPSSEQQLGLGNGAADNAPKMTKSNSFLHARYRPATGVAKSAFPITAFLSPEEQPLLQRIFKETAKFSSSEKNLTASQKTDIPGAPACDRQWSEPNPLSIMNNLERELTNLFHRTTPYEDDAVVAPKDTVVKADATVQLLGQPKLRNSVSHMAGFDGTVVAALCDDPSAVRLPSRKKRTMSFDLIMQPEIQRPYSLVKPTVQLYKRSAADGNRNWVLVELAELNSLNLDSMVKAEADERYVFITNV